MPLSQHAVTVCTCLIAATVVTQATPGKKPRMGTRITTLETEVRDLRTRVAALEGRSEGFRGDNITHDNDNVSIKKPSVAPSRSAKKLIDFTVIKRTEFLTEKVSYQLRIGLQDGRLPTKRQLAAVSNHLYLKEKPHDRTYVSFLLPGMKVNAGCFANAHHNPKLKVEIFPYMLPEEYRHLVKP